MTKANIQSTATLLEEALALNRRHGLRGYEAGNLSHLGAVALRRCTMLLASARGGARTAAASSAGRAAFSALEYPLLLGSAAASAPASLGGRRDAGDRGAGGWGPENVDDDDDDADAALVANEARAAHTRRAANANTSASASSSGVGAMFLFADAGVLFASCLFERTVQSFVFAATAGCEPPAGLMFDGARTVAVELDETRSVAEIPDAVEDEARALARAVAK